MAELSNRLSEAVRKKILADMRPSLFTIYAKSGLAVFVGGALSLMVCGQFGVGITHASMHFNSELHAHSTSLLSAFLCGIAFAIIPPFVLRVLCTPMQFRAITRHSVHGAMVWLIGLGGVLAHHGEMVVELFTFVLWAGTSIATFVALARLIDRYAYDGVLGLGKVKSF